MRKIVTVALVCLLGASLVPTALAGKGKQQKVEGSIALPARHPDGCYAGIHRRIAILTNEQVNGDVGYHFDIDPSTWNKNFVLEVTGGAGYIDLDIVFYQKFGTTDDVVNDPLNAGTPVTITYEERNAEGEAGKVPKLYNKAIVCMYADETQGTGVGATFTYTAGKGVKPAR